MTREFLWAWTVTGVLILAAAEGCPPAAVTPVLDLEACVAGVETTEPTGAPVLKLIADAFLTCAGDIPAVIRALGKAHAKDPAFLAALDAAMQEYSAHPATFRAKLAAVYRPAPADAGRP